MFLLTSQDFGGLDHVLNEGHDIKILIMDTELYSNTGGQKSKGSAKGSVAKFAYSGHDRNKKDFGSIVMGYETVYLAQVALNANPMQTLKAFLEVYYKGFVLFTSFRLTLTLVLQ